MAFESLSAKFQNIFRNLRNKGRLTEADVDAAMKEVKMALLEADVNFRLVKKFVNSVKERAIGSDVLKSLTPGQMVIKIVNEELTEVMGGEASELDIQHGAASTVIMMAGLQGSGKTTTAAKLAGKLKEKGRRPLLAACDIYRPAAEEQLRINGEKLGVPVFGRREFDNSIEDDINLNVGDKKSAAGLGGSGGGKASDGANIAVQIASAAVKHAEKNNNNPVIIDTAGRLQIDEDMMAELEEIKAKAGVTYTILVVDAMTGQDAVNIASGFKERIGVDGVILTKLDGDARGGAAISVKEVTGVPILFAGMGEKLSDLEQFHPDRMASRILGMGDVLSLIEKAEQAVDEEEALALEKRLRKAEFTFDDYLTSMQQMKKMGGLGEIMKMLPGMGKLAGGAKLGSLEVDEKKMARIEAIIYSMTPKERSNPKLMNPSRKIRIAKGAGVDISEVNKLIKQFEQAGKMMKQFGGGKKRRGGFNFPF